ncbi:MAG: deoxyribodipyrimidine photolyase [Ekhidna sp.]|nr:deoxyribodipyrimidine photolyase [Ekhidna sp.]
MFSTEYQDILKQINQINPVAYGRTRNFVDGSVTKLSPYISRGCISTKQIFQSVLDQGFHLNKIEKFIRELAWRDYWQQVWINKKEGINQDIKREQPDVQNQEMPKALINLATGIHAIDLALKDFYETGYLHNHVRMYIACIACNIGGSHWREPAKWMYYHLLDGDWASNALSWQWVSGANAGKKYYANQQNINKYCYSNQKGTFMDVEYEKFYRMEIPSVLQETVIPKLKTPLPKKQEIQLDLSLPTLIYNWYNLDPKWHQNERVNRVLLLEPSIFEKYPISKNAVTFMLGLLKNIPGIQIFVGEFSDLIEKYQTENVIYKEHPLNDYRGTEEPRDWMFSVSGYYKSFFAFWKQCQKELKQWNPPTLFG